MTNDESQNDPGDIPNLFEIVAGRATVGFLKIKDETVASRGSGTFVRYRESAGILTCAHVAEELLNEKRVGLVLFLGPKKFQSLKIERTDFTTVQLGKAPWTSKGPDLAFLKLPPHIMANIEARATVLNLERHHADISAGELDTQKTDMVAGVISEWTADAITSGKLVTTTMEALLNEGNVIATENVNGFDLHRFKPSPNGQVQLPSTYKGTSGGGLWRFYVEEVAPSTYEIKQTRLIGVAFYEENGEIICHGEHSIYENLLRKL